MQDETKFDTRTLRRHLKSGVATKEEYEAYLETLEDCSEDAVETDTKMVFERRDDE